MDREYSIIDGIKCYAPQFAYSSENYPVEHYKELAKLESNHFWFRSRNRIISHLTRKYCAQESDTTFLEIGCGTGVVIHHLAQEFNYHFLGAELHIEGLQFAKQRLPNVEFLQLDVRDLPYQEKFTTIGAFDVLEHIHEDEQAISSIYNALSKQGIFLLTVPQHQWLWSNQDKMAFHKRRYTRKDLLNKLSKAGFHIEFVTSFVFTLLPLMVSSRLRFLRNRHHEPERYHYNELNLSRPINRGLEIMMKFDEFLINKNISLPVGGSLCVVARKI